MVPKPSAAGTFAARAHRLSGALGLPVLWRQPAARLSPSRPVCCRPSVSYLASLLDLLPRRSGANASILSMLLFATGVATAVLYAFAIGSRMARIDGVAGIPHRLALSLLDPGASHRESPLHRRYPPREKPAKISLCVATDRNASLLSLDVFFETTTVCAAACTNEGPATYERPAPHERPAGH
jgi:hypothetical protein